MEVLQQIFVMIVTLGVLVAFHEYGHFWVARKCGIKVLKFSVGFGPSIVKWFDKHQTEYCLAIIPLGGFVKMLDEREGDVADEEKHLAFNNQPVWQRILVVAAGPVANFILAIVVYWVIFLNGITSLASVIFEVTPDSVAANAGVTTGMEIVAVDGKPTLSAQSVARAFLSHIGDTGDIHLSVKADSMSEPQAIALPIHEWLKDESEAIDPVADLGLGFYSPKIDPVIQKIIPNSAASRAGLLPGDKLLTLAGEPIDDWKAWAKMIQAHPDKPMAITVQRGADSLPLTLTPEGKKHGDSLKGFVGIQVKLPKIPDELLRKQEYNPISAILAALKRTWQNIVFSLTSLKKLLLGQLSYKQLSGPISIAQVANDSFNVGFMAYLGLLALLSVSLGVLNLLPVPVLDGGHIFFYLIEWVKGSPVPEKVQLVAYQIGLFIVLAIMALAIFNDINRLT
ncbi:MAG: RIP metalloprotease RseP [Cellvibrionales bacterium]|nr:RIP metalloprotease RseP [Cellvibrionales bacterium]